MHGHGIPDGGASSEDGVLESVLNLEIAKKLEALLIDKGFDVIMTRKDDNNIAGEELQNASLREIKRGDIANRIKIINNSNAKALISIHMNKFDDSKYSGWQTFYSENSSNGKRLAEEIQMSIKKETGIENKRTALKISNIKIIDESKMPAIIVECGFLSNKNECDLLQDEIYQEKIARGILNGIVSYLQPSSNKNL